MRPRSRSLTLTLLTLSVLRLTKYTICKSVTIQGFHIIVTEAELDKSRRILTTTLSGRETRLKLGPTISKHQLNIFLMKGLILNPIQLSLRNTEPSLKFICDLWSKVNILPNEISSLNSSKKPSTISSQLSRCNFVLTLRTKVDVTFPRRILWG